MNKDELIDLQQRLKSGEYDGADIMSAWIAIDELMVTRMAVTALAAAYSDWPMMVNDSDEDLINMVIGIIESK